MICFDFRFNQREAAGERSRRFRERGTRQKRRFWQLGFGGKSSNYVRKYKKSKSVKIFKITVKEKFLKKSDFWKKPLLRGFLLIFSIFRGFSTVMIVSYQLCQQNRIIAQCLRISPPHTFRRSDIKAVSDLSGLRRCRKSHRYHRNGISVTPTLT